MTPAQMFRLASEEEVRIVENLFLRNNAARRTAVFTAPDRSSGCSWIVARTARTLAQRVPGSVCVLDANLRWPALHDLFWLENTRGLLQAMEEPHPIREYAQRVHETNIWVLTSGGTADDSRITLLSETFKARFAELLREFDYVLVDTVAMKMSPDASIIGSLTDCAILVLAANSTTRESAISTKVMLEAAAVSIAGAVLNKRTYPIPDRIYRYL